MEPIRNRLSQYIRLPEEHWDPLNTLPGRQATYKPATDIVVSGAATDRVFFLLQGWALRYRTLEDGRRQIVNFMLPGDVFDLQALANLKADHSVSAVLETKVFEVDSKIFLDMMSKSSSLTTAFWWSAVQEESILREQIVRIGRRSARERICHILLELQRRLSGAYGRPLTEVALPVTRTDLADTLGLTPVHVSRSLSSLRRDGVIEVGNKVVSILDVERMKEIAHFDPDYLHLQALDFVDRLPSTNNGQVSLTGSSNAG